MWVASPLLAAVALLGGVARAQSPLDTFEMRLGIFDQQGEGYQSKAGPRLGPGDEQATIIEPMFRLVARDGADWTHDAIVDVDIVSAASPDAIDAISSASRTNEAVGVDVTSTHAPSGLSMRYGFHFEEPLRSFFAGAGFARGFAEENTVVSASLRATVDAFDLDAFDGFEGGVLLRESLNLNAALSQIVSPTTRVDAGYGFTLQHGTLETTWNSVPLVGNKRGAERFPRRRGRHALTAGVAQIVPATMTTGKVSYRFYTDDFGLVAHTVQLWLYQRLAPWLTVRLGYRHHHQSGADFYGEMFVDEPMVPRTADSDLAPLTSRHLEAKLTLDAERAGGVFARLKRSLLDIAVSQYHRSNGLDSMIVSFGWGYRF